MIKLTLKEYLKEKKIPVQFLHEKTGIRYATLIDIIHNKRKGINREYLGRIMDAINISDVSLIIKKDKTA